MDGYTVGGFLNFCGSILCTCRGWAALQCAKS